MLLEAGFESDTFYNTDHDLTLLEKLIGEKLKTNIFIIYIVVKVTQLFVLNV